MYPNLTFSFHNMILSWIDPTTRIKKLLKVLISALGTILEFQFNLIVLYLLGC